MVKNLPAMWEDLGSIPGLGRSPGEGNGYPLQYSGRENSMDCIVHGVPKSRTRLSNFHSQWEVIRRRERRVLRIFIWQILCVCIHDAEADAEGEVQILWPPDSNS